MSSMKQQPFIQKHESLWESFESWLEYHENKRQWLRRHGTESSIPEMDDYPHTYRQICHHLAIAKTRCYSTELIERLNHMSIRGQRFLYDQRSGFFRHIAEYFSLTFPRMIRKEWRLLIVASLLFYLPFLGMIALIQVQPEMVYSVLDDETVYNLESMYSPVQEDRFGREDEADSDLLMFGFYIRNNTGIDFRTFAGGLAFGLGTLFFTVYNGFVIGASAGHLTHINYGSTFWPFVAGHSALELTALVFSTIAGLKLAFALLMPGRKSRIRALIDTSKDSVLIMYGTATMTIMAAFVEAFWSSIAWVPSDIKYGVGAAMWLLLILYFSLMGKQRGHG